MTEKYYDSIHNKSKLAVCSLYVASYTIAKPRKAHTTGEDLLMPFMK